MRKVAQHYLSKTSVYRNRALVAQKTSHALAIGVGGIMDTADRLLTIDEAAEILRLSKDFLYRYWKKFPFAFQITLPI